LPVFELKECLRRGIRPDAIVGRELDYLVESRFWRSTPYGLKPHRAITQPFTDNYLAARGTKAWPFPQLFVGKGVTLLCFDDTIYTVAEGMESWTATPATILNAGLLNPAVPLTGPWPSLEIAAGGPWQFVDFWSSYVLLNGATVVLKSPIKAPGITSEEHYGFVGGTIQCLQNAEFAAATGWTLGDQWTVSGGALHKAASSGTSVAVQSAVSYTHPMPQNVSLVVSIKVTSLAGSLRLFLGGTLLSTITETGTYTYTGRYTNTSAVTLSGYSDTVAVIDYCRVEFTAPTITTGANWNDGRLVFAGFNPADIYSLADWPAYCAALTSNAPAEVQTLLSSVTMAAGANWVWWGRVGGGDLLNFISVDWMLRLSLAASAGMGYDAFVPSFDELGSLTSQDRQWFIEYLAENLGGMAPLPWQGKALVAKQIGQHMAVYGGYNSVTHKSGGISILTNYADGNVGIKPPDIGSSVGILSRGVVAGDGETHMFIDEGYDAWLMDAAGHCDCLQAKNLIEPLADAEIAVTFDPRHREFYVSNGVMAYTFGKGGWSRAPWMPTSISFAQGNIVSVFFTDAESTGEFATPILTNPGVIGISNLEWVRFVGKNTATNGWQVAVDYRAKTTDDWTRTAFVVLDGRGIVFFDCPGIEWRVVGKAVAYGSCECDNLFVEFSRSKPKIEPVFEAAVPGVAQD